MVIKKSNSGRQLNGFTLDTENEVLFKISSATKNSPPKAGEGTGEAVPCYLLFATASVQTGEFVLTLNYCKRKSISYMKHVFLIKSRSFQK
ncbi:hypothetical protein DSY26_08430 [Lactobacillus delbrueckii]|nr:hypothetical protein DSY26_08430 [Lactobacillus delbrueckii]